MSTRSGWLGLGVLFTVYALNYLDRSLIYILFTPIKAELHLGDFELALLGSTAFVLFYTTLGIPFGRLADRVSRLRMIAAGLVLWSVASASTGFAGSFLTLLACRVLVGVGEATLGPAAFSLLADWFPPQRRATAAALFATGIPIGAGLAMILGGRLAETYGWRFVFPALSLPGLLVAVGVLMLREPTRGASEARQVANQTSVWAVLRSSKTVRWHFTGYATFAIAANALAMWVPSLLAGRFARGLGEVGLWVGGCAVIGGLIGVTLGGVIADAMQRRWNGGRLLFGAAAAAGTAAAWLVLLNAGSVPVAVGACGVAMALGLAWLGPASADVQDMVAPEHRGTAISAYYLVVNLVGFGVGPPLIGAINDSIGASTDPSLLTLSLLVCPIAASVGALLLLGGARSRSQVAPEVDVLRASS